MPHPTKDNAAGDPGDREAGGAAADPQALRGYEVLICVTGGIAAYKTAALVSKLVQDGCGVTVAMTRSARRFVGPTTFRALTGRPVLRSLWRTGESSQFQHLEPTEAADLVVVAPATANIIGKLAGGIADDLVSTLLLGADSPVLLAPAMNARMWQHPAVQRNITFLRDNGFGLVGPEEGWLACGEVGPGRMAEPQTLLAAIQEQLLSKPPQSR
uniref:Coenzyme A biosynthesis bifunctional protein CoaBC n=1 Tax=uncultured Planctomycetota bacterium TaxID=120965 RepID=A0A5B8KDZ7_9BACT|nr:coenzyme A biosynthesis bifunctional protein CoaBC [uncultured Planctomycetota bacterium]